MTNIYNIGTKTKFGIIQGIQFREDERYYFIVDKKHTVSYMPQCSIKSILI